MKKSISAILIAALMLFAFTACEQQMQWPTNLEALNVTYAGTSESFYIVGETIDPADVSVNVEFTDGTSRTYSGEQLGLTALQLASTSTNTNVSFAGKNDWQISIPAVAVADCTYIVDVSGAKATIIEKNGTLSTVGVKVEASYEGATKDVTDVTSIASTITYYLAADTTGAVDTKTAVELDENAPSYITLEGTWELTVKDSDYDAETDLVSVSVTQADDNEVFAVGTTKNKLSNVKYVVTGTYADGHSAVISGATVEFDDYATTYAFTSTAPMTFDVTYTSNNVKYPAKLTVTPIADYPISIGVAWRDTNSTTEGVQAPTYKPGDTVPVSDIVFTVANAGTSWASGNTYTDSTNPGVNTANIVLQNAYIKHGTTATSQTITPDYKVETVQSVTFNPTTLSATISE